MEAETEMAITSNDVRSRVTHISDGKRFHKLINEPKCSFSSDHHGKEALSNVGLQESLGVGLGKEECPTPPPRRIT